MNQIKSTPSDLAYQQAKQSAVYYIEPNPGIFLVNGEDRVDFLQRQTTNELENRSLHNAVTTVLTSPIGRILDVFQVLFGENTLTVITLPGHGTPTTNFLKGKVFFNDNVTLEEVSSNFALIELIGPGAEAVLQEGLQLGTDIPTPEKYLSLTVDDAQIIITTLVGPVGVPGFLLIVPSKSNHTITAKLQSAGASSIDFDTREILRIEAGTPGAKAELTQDYTPLETDLRFAVSETKGCYTGQEVIARQINYDKVTKKLIQLKLVEDVTPGAKVQFNEKNVGKITSAVNSPLYGPIALALLRRPFPEPGTSVTVISGENQVEGEVFSPK